jgi:hypothetical protein
MLSGTARMASAAAGDVAEGLDEDGEAEDPVDDGGHPGEVADVDVDEPRHPCPPGVLLEVDRGGDADREGQEHDEHGDPERPPERLGDTGTGRVRAEVAGEEVPEARGQHVPAAGDDVDQEHDQGEQGQAQGGQEGELEGGPPGVDPPPGQPRPHDVGPAGGSRGWCGQCHQ